MNSVGTALRAFAHPTITDYKREVIDKQVALMQKRGVWKKPAKT